MANNFYDPFNSIYISNNELYDHHRSTMPFPMDAEEIRVDSRNEERQYYYQAPPFYYNEDHDHRYDRRDYDRNERRHRGSYVLEQTPFSMDTEELHQISVRIQLTRYVDNLSIRRLSRNHDLRCSPDCGNILTVTGYPSNNRNGQTEFLQYVREFDSGARLAGRQ